MNALQIFWQARNPRERSILQVGAGILLIAVLYGFIWQPGEKARARYAKSIPVLRAQLARMRVQSSEIKRLQQDATPSLDSAHLRQDILSSATRNRLRDNVHSLTVSSAGEIHLLMQNVPFDGWIQWLSTLQRENRLRLTGATLQESTPSGGVTVDATLTLAGAESE